MNKYSMLAVILSLASLGINSHPFFFNLRWHKQLRAASDRMDEIKASVASRVGG